MDRNYLVKLNLIAYDCIYKNYYLTNKYEEEMLSTIVFYETDPELCCDGDDTCFRCDGVTIQYKSTEILNTDTEIESAKKLISDKKDNQVYTLSELFTFIIETNPKDIVKSLMNFCNKKIIISETELYNSTIKIFYNNSNDFSNKKIINLLRNVTFYFEKDVLITLIDIIRGYISKDQFDSIIMEFSNKLFILGNFEIINHIGTTYKIDFYETFSNNKKQ